MRLVRSMEIELNSPLARCKGTIASARPSFQRSQLVSDSVACWRIARLSELTSRGWPRGSSVALWASFDEDVQLHVRFHAGMYVITLHVHDNLARRVMARAVSRFFGGRICQ